MPRGLPDYYNPDTLVSQRLANVEEVVTTQRGIAGIDNRGRTFFFESFAETLSAWQLGNSFDGDDPVISTGAAYIPPSSAYLQAGTLGNTGVSWMRKHLQLGASTRLGFETSIFYQADGPEYRMYFAYTLEDLESAAYLSVLPATGVVRIGKPGTWNNVANVGYNAESGGTWLPLKLVADFENSMFVRLLVGQEQIDLSDYAIGTAESDFSGRLRFLLMAYAVNAVTNDGYFGYAAFTVDEP